MDAAARARVRHVVPGGRGDNRPLVTRVSPDTASLELDRRLADDGFEGLLEFDTSDAQRLIEPC